MTQELTLKEYRIKNGISQAEAAKICSFPLRTYQNYENQPEKIGTIKYQHLLTVLKNYFRIDEETGLLTLEMIKECVTSVLQKYDVQYCYLFGSYARGEATEQSDVDLVIDNSVHGIDFFGLIEELRETLCKKVDLLDARQLTANPELMDNVLREGIRIYAKR